MLKNGVIRPSASPWSSPVVLAPKKGNTWWFCINVKKLNEVTKTDAYPLPLINDLLDRLGKAKFFSSLNAFAGFHRIPLHPDSIPKTSFVLPWGQWEYLRMPFGLKNAPATFQRTMNTILKPVLDKFAFVYVDDIIIFSETFEEHLQHIQQVFSLVRQACLRLNTKKCYFLKKHLEYLGYVVSAEGTHADPKKIEKIQN